MSSFGARRLTLIGVPIILPLFLFVLSTRETRGSRDHDLWQGKGGVLISGGACGRLQLRERWNHGQAGDNFRNAKQGENSFLRRRGWTREMIPPTERLRGGGDVSEQQHEVEQMRQRAGVCHLRGEYQEALELWSQAIEAEPTVARSYTGRGQTHNRLNMHAEAKKDAETAQALGGDKGGFKGWRKLERAKTAPPTEPERMVMMTLRVKATLDYGETLWVTGNHPVLGGWVSSGAVQMLTRNSTYPVWTGEFRLPVVMRNDLRYKYVIRPAEGKGPEKWEDRIGDRIISTRFMNSALMRGADKHVVEDGEFNKVSPLAEAHMAQDMDQDDVPSQALHTHEIPSAANTRTDPSGSELVSKDAHSKGEQLVSFQVQVNTNYGEEVWLCGSDPSIGAWVPAKGIKLSTSKHVYPQWVGRLVLNKPLETKSMAYKYVIKVPDGSWSWEDRIPDRQVSPSGLETVVHDGRFNQAQRQVTFVKLEGVNNAPPRQPDVPNDPQSASLKRKIMMLKKRLAELQREEAVRRHELASMRDKGKSKAEEIDLGQAMEECRAHIKALDLSQQKFNKQVEERKADMEVLLKAAQQAAAKADSAVAATNEALKERERLESLSKLEEHAAGLERSKATMLNDIQELNNGIQAMAEQIASTKAACEASIKEANEHRLAIEELAALPKEVPKCEETQEIVERLKKELADLELQKDNDEQQCRRMKAQLQSLVMGRVAVGQNGTSTKAAKNVRDAFDKLVELDKERDMLEFKFNECIKARQVSQSLLYRLDQVVASKQNETAEFGDARRELASQTLKAEWAACRAKREFDDRELQIARLNGKLRVMRDAVKSRGGSLAEFIEAAKAAEQRESHLRHLIAEADAEPPGEGDLAELHEVAIELETDGEKLRQDLDEAEREEADMQAAIAKRNKEETAMLADLQPKLDALKSQVAKAEESLAAQSDEAAKLAAELSGVAAEATLREAQLERMTKDRDIAEDQKRTAVLKGLSNQNQTEMARGVLEAMREMLVNDKAVIARANDELQSVQAKVAAVKAEDDAASKRVSEAAAKLKMREAEKARVKKQLREADKKEDLAEMAQRLRKQLADEIQGINILTSDRLEQTTRLVKLEAEIAEANATIMGLAKEEEDFEDAKERHKEKYEEEEGRRRTLEMRRDNVERQLEEMTTELSRLRREAERLRASRKEELELRGMRTDVKRAHNETHHVRQLLEEARQGLTQGQDVRDDQMLV